MKKIIIRKHLLWTIISFFWTQTLQHSAEWKVKWLPKKQYGWKQNLFSLSEANVYKMVKWKLNEILKCRWHRSVWDEGYEWAKKRLADHAERPEQFGNCRFRRSLLLLYPKHMEGLYLCRKRKQFCEVLERGWVNLKS